MSKRRRWIVRLIVYPGLVLGGLAFLYCPRGEQVTDGRHDRGQNGIWLQHGWLGHRDWFVQNDKLSRLPEFRDPRQVRQLVALLRRHHIRDLFPHLCPARGGRLPAVDDEATAHFLDASSGLRVMPWIGGVLDRNARPNEERWRRTFVGSARALLDRHPRLAGLHLNIEPCPSGHKGFLELLDELREVLPAGKRLSVAAYPPPTRWHPHPDVHWDEAYYRQVARRADQLAVMMYDTSLRFGALYQGLMADWTEQLLGWTRGARSKVLLGLPAYDDAGVGYHDPAVENLDSALPGIHAGLQRLGALPAHYQGVALYAEWELDAGEWAALRRGFLGARAPPR